MVQQRHAEDGLFPLLELSTELELSSVLTVHGSLKICDSGTLFFSPALDARLMGVAARELPLNAVRGLQRSHQGRRVVVQSDVPLTFRGPGAYQAWLALQLLRDCEKEGLTPLFVPVRRQLSYATLSGRLGIGRTGFGFAAAESPLFGAWSTFWGDFDALERFDATTDALHLKLKGGSYTFQLEGASSLLGPLRRRWLVSQPAPTGKWPAIRRNRTGLECGSLIADPRGLLFCPKAGAAQLLAKRGHRIHVREEEDCILLSGDGANWGTFWVANVHVAAEGLRAEIRSPAWLSEAQGVCDLSHIRGPCQVELAVGTRSYAQSVSIHGRNGTIQFLLASDQSIEPWTACSIQLTGGGHRCRFDGIVLAWQPSGDGLVMASLCATAPLHSLDRRSHLRLAVEDRVGRCTEVATRKCVDEAVLLDLSRGGAGLWLSRQIPMGGKVDLLLEVVRKEGTRKRIMFFPVSGTVVNGRPEQYGGRDGWRTGIRFAGIEVAVFDARHGVWLQERRTLDMEP